MSYSAIKISNISKKYRIGDGAGYKTFREAIANLSHALFSKLRGKKGAPALPIDKMDAIWALKDISFDVKQGEVIGIIGRNGAGKSTLLKILSKITEPTTGRIELRGRVGSLLEVGTGFHPELTGHENIYLYGALLGMDRWEVTRKFDEIVDFAELKEFAETPVKRYSSGMYMRLAFAVAAHLETEILLVDEVLAVGDAAFQEKCLGKMEDVSQKGRTVIFVTHNMSSVANLCNSAILLDEGRIKTSGETAKVIDEYLSSLKTLTASADLNSYQRRRGTGEARITGVSISDNHGKPCTSFKYGDDICFRYMIEAKKSCPKLITVVWIKTATGIPVLHLANHDDSDCGPFQVDSVTQVQCKLNSCMLLPGSYLVSLWVAPDHYSEVDFVQDVIQFRMEQGELMKRGFDMSWKIGIYHSPSEWNVKTVTDKMPANEFVHLPNQQT
jgi:lipopolysaccharide transport system ATP-binding protein